jgi:imidazolonepropionase-like amidohydrolase
MKRVLVLSLLMLTGAVPMSLAATPGQPVVFRDVTVIDGTGAAPKTHMNVVILGNRIAEVVPNSEAQVPEGAHVIDANGNFLIPGLWDMHLHLSKAGENTLALLIANGVTGVRDMGGDLGLLAQWRREIDEGKRLGPRIKMAGPMLEASTNIDRMQREGTVEPVDRFRIGVAGPEEAESVVDRLAAKGVDFIKVRTVTSVETYRALSAAARKHHLALVGHLVASPEETLEAGQRSIEHGFYPPLDDRSPEQRHILFTRVRERAVAVVPTLVVGEALLTPYPTMKAIADDQGGLIEPKRKYLGSYLIRDWKEQVEEQKEPWPGMNDFLIKRVRDLREMVQTGVRIMPGTDTAVLLIWPGFSLHRELKLLVEQVGLTPMQAIVSATRWPAEFLGVENSLGTIERGKLADLVLLEGNPIENIDNTSKIAAVVRDGQFLSKSAIEKMLAQAAARAHVERD